MRKDLTGQMFGRLTVLEVAGRNREGSTLWRCRCACGVETIVVSRNLASGNSKSCGCLRLELARAQTLVHGHAHKGRETREYWTWQAMLRRCRDPHSAFYAYYGGRGITVCERWLSFTNFLADMGSRPAGTSIERQDNNKGYAPENCYWGTRQQQAINQRRKPRASRFFGVERSRDRRSWCARIKVSNKRYYLGTFRDEIDAARAYDAAALKYYGNRAMINFPQKAA